MRDSGGDLDAGGDESFCEEAERVLCNGEGKVKPAAERRKGWEGSPAVPISAFHIRLSKVFYAKTITAGFNKRGKRSGPR